MREHTGPPYPDMMVEDIQLMPYVTPEEIEAKKAAARLWIVQYCARARFHLDVKDLHLSIRVEHKCAEKIDKVRRYLTEAEIDAALSGS